ncbi:hypothetical protein HK101_005513 [Irineochytrium annulatum]|nr:hypothetical protein HK101_005513 [Irineochytrium annulatum]
MAPDKPDPRMRQLLPPTAPARWRSSWIEASDVSTFKQLPVHNRHHQPGEHAHLLGQRQRRIPRTLTAAWWRRHGATVLLALVLMALLAVLFAPGDDASAQSDGAARNGSAPKSQEQPWVVRVLGGSSRPVVKVRHHHLPSSRPPPDSPLAYLKRARAVVAGSSAAWTCDAQLKGDLVFERGWGTKCGVGVAERWDARTESSNAKAEVKEVGAKQGVQRRDEERAETLAAAEGVDPAAAQYWHQRTIFAAREKAVEPPLSTPGRYPSRAGWRGRGRHLRGGRFGTANFRARNRQAEDDRELSRLETLHDVPGNATRYRGRIPVEMDAEEIEGWWAGGQPRTGEEEGSRIPAMRVRVGDGLEPIVRGASEVECGVMDPSVPERYCRTRNIAIRAASIPRPSRRQMQEGALDLPAPFGTLMASCELNETWWFHGRGFGAGAAGWLYGKRLCFNLFIIFSWFTYG